MEKVYLNNNAKLKVAVVSFPMGSALVANVFLYNLVEILEPLCKYVYVVTGNIPKNKILDKKIILQDVKTVTHLKGSIHPMWWSDLLQFFKIIIIQIKMCWILAKISRKIDIVIFYTGGGDLFLPILMAKLFGKKVVTSAIGLGSLSYGKVYKKGFSMGYIISVIYGIFENANFFLSDRIIVESESVVGFLGLNKYKLKISELGARYIDKNIFYIKKDIRNRKKIVGYIGRLSEEKGIMNFVKAMPLILEKDESIEFFIGGDGPLCVRIKEELKNNQLSKKVKMKGWIPHYKVADYLNEFKLSILPSYSEGLPTGVLEAMACGTPVLATPVGGVPDVIKDGETGFILKENIPECIAENVIRIFKKSTLDKIVENANDLIIQEFTYDCAVKRYEKILGKL